MVLANLTLLAFDPVVLFIVPSVKNLNNGPLAFAKAVLDYSNEDRRTDKLKVSHDYPFLIDSPFTELSGKNLDNVAQYIHTFANQIILMADDKSYGGVQQLVAPSVKSTARLLKDSTEGITYTK